MRAITLLLVLSLSVLCAACAGTQKIDYSPGQKDIVVDVRNDQWDFSTVSRVYFYTETVNSSEEKEAIDELMRILSQRGIECILDTGESMVYENASFHVRAHKKLMSLLTSIYLLKPGIKGNEEVIAIISADNASKAAVEAATYIAVVRPPH